MRRYSLRQRLLLWLFVASALLGVIALADTWFEAKRTAQGVSDRVLAGSALAIAERVSPTASGRLGVDIPYSALEMLTSTAQDQVFYRVDGPNGFLTGYEALAPLHPSGPTASFADAQFNGVPIRVATLSRQISTGQSSISYSVTVAESTLARNQLARAILLRSALRLAVLAAAAAVIVWIAVSLALRPLDQLGAVIRQRSPDDLRPVMGNTPQEVAGLLNAINQMMGRLDHALTALRNFTGNASHQLRTPLATVRTQLAMAARAASVAEYRTSIDRADAALVRAERVLAQLLVLARADAARHAAPEATDIAALARDVTAELVPEADRVGIDLGYEGAIHLIASAEPILLQELLRNLIDNAVKYSGTGSRVTVRIGAAEDGTFLEVEDTGPGLPEQQLAGLATSERRQMPSLSGAGLGLGLAVVREIASVLRVRMAFRRADPIGTIVRITWPS